MQHLISEDYRKQNQQLHKSNPEYGTSGVAVYSKVLEILEAIDSQDMLDYGSGKGTLALALPFYVREYDPAIAGSDQPPEPADFVVCTEVMEHVEPDKVEAVLDDICRLTKKVTLFTIATAEAKKTLPDGRNAHLVVEDSEWWLPLLMKRWRMMEYMVAGENHFLFIGVPKEVH